MSKNFLDKNNPKEISDVTAVEFIRLIEKIVDDCLIKRFAENDIMQFYDGKITSVSQDGLIATVLYNDIYYEAKNCTGVSFLSGDVGDFVKMGTCDGITYFILCKYTPKAMNTLEFKNAKQFIIDNRNGIIRGWCKTFSPPSAIADADFSKESNSASLSGAEEDPDNNASNTDTSNSGITVLDTTGTKATLEEESTEDTSDNDNISTTDTTT